MARTYDPQAIVDLPRLDAAAAAAVGTAVEAVAKEEKKLAPNVAAGRTRLDASVSGLKSVQAAGLGTAPEPLLGRAVRAETAAWSGTESWLRGLASMAGSPAAATAQKLLDALLPDGLLFVRLPAAQRWSESDARIQRIHKDFEADFAALGGAVVLQHLRATHAATGAAAGITVAKDQPETPQVRAALNAVKASLRNYVLQVVANAAAEDTPAARALAAKLLAPITNYTAPESAKVAVQPVAPVPAAVDTPAQP